MGEIFKKSDEEAAIDDAKKSFDLWQQNHSIELAISKLLDIEFKNLPFLENPRRAHLFENARNQRRSLAFKDDFVPYIYLPPSQLEERLSTDKLLLSYEEYHLIKEVNHGFWLRVGLFTRGIRRLERLDK